MLMYLSKNEPVLPVTIAEVASQFGVPHNHLIKVANRLGKLGFIKAVRGRNGGLSLAVDANELRLGEVLRGLEGDGALVNCAEPPCALDGRCLLSKALNEGLAAFYAHMNQYTLADVASGRTATALVTLHRNYLVSREGAQSKH